MSSQNAFPGPNGGRPAARPTTQTGNGQPSWVHPQAQGGGPQQPQQPAPAYPSYPQPGYGAQAPDQQQYGQWSELQPQGAGSHAGFDGYPQGASAGQGDPYAPQFEPYVPPSRPNYGQGQQPAPGFGGQQQPQTSGPAVAAILAVLMPATIPRPSQLNSPCTRPRRSASSSITRTS